MFVWCVNVCLAASHRIEIKLYGAVELFRSTNKLVLRMGIVLRPQSLSQLVKTNWIWMLTKSLREKKKRFKTNNQAEYCLLEMEKINRMLVWHKFVWRSNRLKTTESIGGEQLPFTFPIGMFEYSTTIEMVLFRILESDMFLSKLECLIMLIGFIWYHALNKQQFSICGQLDIGRHFRTHLNFDSSHPLIWQSKIWISSNASIYAANERS